MLAFHLNGMMKMLAGPHLALYCVFLSALTSLRCGMPPSNPSDNRRRSQPIVAADWLTSSRPPDETLRECDVIDSRIALICAAIKGDKCLVNLIFDLFIHGLRLSISPTSQSFYFDDTKSFIYIPPPRCFMHLSQCDLSTLFM